MPSGAFPTCDMCGTDMPVGNPQYRLTHAHIVTPHESVALVTGFPEEDVGIFCSKRCLKRYVQETLGED